ncbi:MAG TPA: carboxypeptidase-like regulatory domain-containing protein [Kofleriaceae bacterium]|nr:carboxypeptidase-like regulatory domain-containing protein [Kofleriaceae bacterium]
MRILLASLVVALVACGPSPDDRTMGDDDMNTDCEGIACQVVQCEKMGKPPTTISGTVYAPNGTLALYGANVYVPLVDPGPFAEGVTCTQCQDQLPGGAVANGMSDTSGKFSVSGVPSGTDIPLFITIGKWRRKTVIPQVLPCQDNPLPNTVTSLPKNKTEGDIPKIAIATGSCDALECLLRKIGVADSEFTADSGSGRIHLYSANGSPKIASSNTMLSPATALWGDVNKMKNYDMMLFSCECGPYPENKSQPMMDNLKAYADMGGRVFLSHYHSVWISGEKSVPTHAPAVWPTVASCNIDEYQSGTGVIDQVNNPKGSAFAQWMTNVQGSTTPGTVEINDSRQSCTSVDNTKAERWVYMKIGGTDYPQDFQFTTPQEVAKEARCGKVVFSDMHVASGSTSSSTGFPSGCGAGAMSPQEKALAFMLFDIATCVGPIL